MKSPKLSSYPKELEIGGETYRIRFIPYQKRPEKDGKRFYGYCDNDLRTIEIMRGQGREESFKTLIHEILHAMEFEYEFDIPHRLVARLEEPLFRFLIDNF